MSAYWTVNMNSGLCRSNRHHMIKILLLICLVGVFLSGCGTMDMRKISVEPKMPPLSAKKSSVRVGVLFSESFTNYKYSFETGKQMYLWANVKGEIDLGKNMSQSIYGIVASKFGNVVVANDIKQLKDIDVYFVPRITYFKYSPPFTGLSSHVAEVELETVVFAADGKLLHTLVIKQEGSRSTFNQIIMESNYEMAHFAVNEAINNLLADFARKIDELY